MKKQFEQVAEFNKTFGKLFNNEPVIPEPAYCEFLYNFLKEELEEFKAGYEAGDIVEVADAFTDILYVLIGAYQAFGLEDKFEPLFDEVQRSNMSKSCNSLEEAMRAIEFYTYENLEVYTKKVGEKWILYRASDHKVQKPPFTYSKPDLHQFFKNDNSKI